MKYFLPLLLCWPLAAQQLVMVSGNGQLLLEQFPSTSQMVVRAQDSLGRPMANVAVAWSITQGQGTIRNAQTQTDAEGLARASFQATTIQPGSSYLQSVVTAAGPFNQVPFFMTTVESMSSGSVQPIMQLYGLAVIRGAAGSRIPEAFVVQVAAAVGGRLGQGIPNVGVRVVLPNDAEPGAPSAACDAPGGVVLTNDRGLATCNLILGPNTGTGTIYAVVGDLSVTRSIGLDVTPSATCVVAASPAALTFGSAGGSATVSLTSACAWGATSSASWITFPGNSTGSGGGQLVVAAAPNAGPARSGTVTIGTATVTVTQTAAGTGLPLSFAVGSVLPTATAGVGYSTTLSGSGGQPPYSWTAGAVLPTGLSLNPGSGVIAGAPSVPGSYQIPVTLRDALGAMVTQVFSLTVNTPGTSGGGLLFLTASLPQGTANVAYQQRISVAGGCQNPFSGGARVEVVSGALPPGLTAQSAVNGMDITGTPVSAGTFNFVVRASDSCGGAVVREFSITIVGLPTVTPLTASVTSVSFSLQRGSGRTPPEQTISVLAGGTAVSFSVSVNSVGGWLQVTPDRATTPALLTVRVIPGDLLPGAYPANINITPDSGSAPLVIPAVLNVTQSIAMTVEPSSINFSFTAGATNASVQTLQIGSVGAVLPFTTSVVTNNGGNWLTVLQTVSITPGLVSVQANPSGLAPGTYTGTITVTPAVSAQPVVVPVSMTLSAAGPSMTSVVNGASFQMGSIAPGQIVTVFGSGMGPAALTTFRLTASGAIDTQLADVRVLFDELPAPLLYVSATQTALIVPYGVAGRTLVRMQVEYRGLRSTAALVPVAESAPGLFTVGGGTQAAALNQDGTVNGVQNGAQPGSIVSLFATGEGITIPGGVDGAVVPPTALARPFLPVTATVDGRPAEVLYAGSAPGQVAGLMQVNVRLPAGTPASPTVPVVITVGSASSQANATIAVRP